MKLIDLVNKIDPRENYFVVHVNTTTPDKDFDVRKHSMTWVSVMANRDVLNVTIGMDNETPFFYITISCIE